MPSLTKSSFSTFWVGVSWTLSAIFLLTACSGGSTETASGSQLFASNSPDVSEAFFDPERLINVAIEMDPDDYELLRQEGRSFGDLTAGCRDFTYTNFMASVSIDGQLVERVGIRKKGFLGSLSAARPSFKLNFDASEPGRLVESMDRMTLNNNRQDGSATHQCVTYQKFRKAGVNAPRCNFAKVSINGQDLGYYSNVESVNEQFVKRNYSNGGGNLYEGQGGAFAPFRKELFQLKTNTAINDRSDLDKVINALEADDANFPGLIEQVIDIDQYIDFWAMEIIMGHWDGGTSNANNYFTYHDPDEGRFNFIPWGTDGAMQLSAGLNGSAGPVWNFSRIANRLLSLPQYRARLFERIPELVSEVFDVDEISAEMDRIQQLTDSNPLAVETTRNFVERQEARIEAALADTSPPSGAPLRDAQFSCNPERETISGSFNETTASFTFINEAGEEQTVDAFVQRGPTGGGILGTSNPLAEAFNIIAFVDGRTIALIVNIEEPEFKVGTIPLHGIATTILVFDAARGGVTFTSGGEITLTEAGAFGEPFSGTFTAEIAQQIAPPL